LSCNHHLKCSSRVWDIDLDACVGPAGGNYELWWLKDIPCGRIRPVRDKYLPTTIKATAEVVAEDLDAVEPR
jgi:hypothetical protein